MFVGLNIRVKAAFRLNRGRRTVSWKYHIVALQCEDFAIERGNLDFIAVGAVSFAGETRAESVSCEEQSVYFVYHRVEGVSGNREYLYFKRTNEKFVAVAYHVSFISANERIYRINISLVYPLKGSESKHMIGMVVSNKHASQSIAIILNDIDENLIYMRRVYDDCGLVWRFASDDVGIPCARRRSMEIELHSGYSNISKIASPVFDVLKDTFLRWDMMKFVRFISQLTRLTQTMSALMKRLLYIPELLKEQLTIDAPP